VDKVKQEKLTFKTMKKRHWAGVIIAGVALGSIIGAMIPSEEKTVEKSKKIEQKVEKPANVDWEVEIKKIVGPGNTTTTENYDKIMQVASTYEPTEKEIKDFSTQIMEEYKSKRYLESMTGNDEYALTNMFKARVIEKYYDDAEQNPIDKFSVDFLQNIKYVYRGVNKIGDHDVTANEHQMDKSLAQLQ